MDHQNDNTQVPSLEVQAPPRRAQVIQMGKPVHIINLNETASNIGLTPERLTISDMLRAHGYDYNANVKVNRQNVSADYLVHPDDLITIIANVSGGEK